MKIISAVGMIQFTLIAYLGLPLLGWGINALPEFFSNPARLSFAIVIVIFAICAAYQSLVIPNAGVAQKGNESKLRTVQSLLGHLSVGLFGYTGFLLVGYGDRHALAVMQESLALRFAGVACLAIGGLVAFIAALQLGQQYSTEITIQRNHKLITQGIYRRLRHPRYLGVILMLIGYALIFRSWIGAGLVIVAAIGFNLRIFGEERMLHKEFG